MHFLPSIGHRPTYRLLPFVLKSLLVTLAGFTSFRLLLVFLNFNQLKANTSPVSVLFSMLRGLGNDLLVAGVLFWLPLLLGALQSVLTRGRKMVLVTGLILTGLSMHLSLIISSLDIPFFQHFFTHLSDMFLNWRDQLQFLVRMVVEEPGFWWFIGLFIALSILVWWWILRRLPQIVHSVAESNRCETRFSWLTITLLLFLSLILRNRLIRKHYYSASETAVSLSPWLEKISQNPMMTLGYALTSRPVGVLLKEKMSLAGAAEKLGKALNRSIDLKQAEPMARLSSEAEGSRRWNVVIVLMESINNERMNSKLMPRLQEISSKGKTWTRFFSAGVHTYAGLYATLCSYPVQLRRHALKWGSDLAYNGLGTVLKQNGYRTLLYSTHDKRFDNMESFFSDNGFSSVIGVDHYNDRALTTFGVPDHVMFRKVVSELDDRGGAQPFLAVLLSSSNHAPYRFPADIPFIPKSTSMPQRMVEYSDWALGEFTAAAMERDWAKRTLFIYLGDHGASGDYRFHLPISMVHVPLIMTGPDLLAAEKCDDLASQLDVMPTVMGQLGLAYRNLGFGVDLCRERRSLSVFCNDEYLGCTDGEYFVSFNFDTPGYAGRMNPSRSPGTMALQRIEEMKDTALAYFRMADWLITEKKQFLPIGQ